VPAHEQADRAEPERSAYARPADWYGWQPDELGHSVDLSRVLIRTERVAIALAGAYVGKAGVRLFLHWTLRRHDLDDAAWSRLRDHLHSETEPPETSSNRLTIKVVLANGAAASTAADFQHDTAPDGPVFSTYFGTTTSGHRERIHGRTRLWLHPLPPPPGMDLTIAWPAADIPPTTTTIDTTAINAAASRSTWLWPEDADLTQQSD
jgi:hypothetical protein